MPVQTGLVVAIAVVLVIVSVGAGYYAGVSMGGTSIKTIATTATTTTTVFVSGFSSAQSTSSGTSPTSTTATSCDQAHPLSLTDATWINQPVAGQEPGSLSMKWYNCAAQNIKFNPQDSPQVQVTVAMTAYGQIEKYSGYLYALFGYTGPFNAPAGGSITVSLPVYVIEAYSPNAAVVWVAGNVTAFDPGTGQAISMPSPFNVTA